jgi:hypothetical protein
MGGIAASIGAQRHAKAALRIAVNKAKQQNTDVCDAQRVAAVLIVALLSPG